ncbi:hypothetical protein ACI3PL_26675, partial [Lacticaseibacillus paracasei]
KVVQAPAPILPPEAPLVTQTEPKPAGYFQRNLLNYFSPTLKPPTSSTPPTPAAAPTTEN